MDTAQQTSDFDAFGDPVAAGRGRVTSSPAARKMTVAVFWTVALVLIAGRVYQHSPIVGPQGHAMELASR